MKKYYSVDHIEEDTAILIDEKKEIVHVPFSSFSHLPKEGDILWIENGKFNFDEAEKQRRKETVKNLLDDIFNKSENEE